MSDNSLRDMIYGDPVGTETMTGMQSATPIDQYATLHRALQIGLPMALGFAGGTENVPQYKSMADFIQLLRSMDMRLPTAETKGTGVIGVTPIGKTSPDVEFYHMTPEQMTSQQYLRSMNIPYSTAGWERDTDPIESALNSLMQRLYGGWE